MSQSRRMAVVLVVCLMAGSAHADEVHLVGGSSIEGKASRKGDKVVIEIESGQIALSADDVERIDPGPSVVQRFEAMKAKIGARDVSGMLTLANFCRDHDMKDRERQVLLQVLEVMSEHAEARARLGYVKTDAGWVRREQRLRDQGFVHYDGRWISPARQLEPEQQQPKSKASARAKRLADVDKPAQGRLDDRTAQQRIDPDAFVGLVDDPFVHVR